MKNSYDMIYQIVKQIPKGKVATYGQVAEAAGNKNLSRVVGNALHKNPDPKNIPCHRVVNRFGKLSEMYAFGGINKQTEKLIEEGVSVIDGFVDLAKFRW